MKRVIDRGIVLRRVNYGESDRVVTMLTQANGKVSVFAKGCRKQKSRLSAGIELLSVSEIGFIDGKSQLKTLTSASLLGHYEGIVKDVQRTKQAFEALLKIDKLSDEGAGQEYFEILNTYLATLNDNAYESAIVNSWLDLHLLRISGHLGDITVETSNSHHKYLFNFEDHSFIDHPTGNYSENDIKLIKLLRSSSKPLKLVADQADRSHIEHLVRQIFIRNLQTEYVQS